MIRATDRGATAVEYAIMVALLAAVIIGAVSYFGDAVVALFTPTSDFFLTPNNH